MSVSEVKSSVSKCLELPLTELPKEIFFKILDYLLERDKASFSRICKRWHDIYAKYPFHDFSYKEITSENLRLLADLFRKNILGANLSRLAPEADRCRDKYNEEDYKVFVEKCSSLQSLSLSSCKISNEVLRFLSKKLKVLDLSNCDKINDAGLEILAEKCPELESLNLNFCKEVTDSGLRALTRCPKLKKLSLIACSKVTDLGLKELAEKISLRNLALNSCSLVTDKGLNYFKTLESISLTGEKLTDKGLIALAKNCSGLNKIKINSGSRITDGSLFEIKCSKLKVFSLSCAQITDEGLIALANNCPKLKKISIDFCDRITPHCMKILKERYDIEVYKFQKVGYQGA